MSVSVVFLAPEYEPGQSLDASAVGPAVQDGASVRDPRAHAGRPRPGGSAGRGVGGEAGLRFTRSAQEAVSRMGADVGAVERVLAEPDEVCPDRDRPERTRFVRGRFTVVTGRDGTVLAVYRR